ncbi:CoA transferase [Sphingomonas sp. G-3-2-10]|uniref:CoA transferase n=1 Tax=Sphingomonas sp. G-3-2-10 TaxID=2728838 RepID=UPI00146D2F6E|nr:CoA transferase [Sphingomonas sp. G-3-2-10]NML06490.1 CoA transferase [Sphingomonas sp. G-3-2-10]
MSIVTHAALAFGEQIAALTSDQLRIDPLPLLDRSADLALAQPGRISANGHCRLIRTANGWIAANLPREDDLASVPAWIGCDPGEEPWPAIERLAAGLPSEALVDQAILLGLAVARLGETRAPSPDPPIHLQAPAPGRSIRRARVIDLSSLWAGPLCGGLLAMGGAQVTKIESRTRPDPVRTATPLHDARLNGAKQRQSIDFANPAALAALRDEIVTADILVTSARPRALAALGLEPEALLAANPSLVWIAITGHGWSGDEAARIGFGDDAAVAGGLVDRDADGAPRFLGDAVADPLTGLAAAARCIDMLNQGEAGLVDAALARTAAGVWAAHG